MFEDTYLVEKLRRGNKMTLYGGFVDELDKLAKKKKREGWSKTLTETGSLAVVGGLIGSLIGTIAKNQSGRGLDYGDLDYATGKTGRPAWSHGARKWGKRTARVGLPMWLSGIALEKIRRGS